MSGKHAASASKENLFCQYSYHNTPKIPSDNSETFRKGKGPCVRQHGRQVRVKNSYILSPIAFMVWAM